MDISATLSIGGGIGGGSGGGGCSDMAASGSGFSSGGGGSSALPPPARSTPRRIRGLHDHATPPPFLINLYTMVNDKETDSIISWGLNRTTFVIPDEKRFILEMLPRYSKSNRFNSFITQLNNYGFQKINWNPSEYEHKWFQEGKLHLLPLIKRKNKQSGAISSQENEKMPCTKSVNELENEFEKLKRKQEEMKDEMCDFKEKIKRTFTELQKTVTDTAHELVPMFLDGESVTGQKRKSDDNLSLDFGEIERDFQSMCKKFGLIDSMIENVNEGEPKTNPSANYMTLRALMENPMDLCCSYNSFVEMGSKGPVFANDESKGENVGAGGSCGGRVTPFLNKLYEMVEKDETDSLISWRLPSRDSFIIWDHNKLATDVLPLYFNHSNFSSFNSQLNLYGFKKISWERHEYANEWFQGGRADLLPNIKRRDIRQGAGCTKTDVPTGVDMDHMMKNELKKLQENQENKNLQLSIYKEASENSLEGFKEMVLSMATIVKRMVQKSEEDLGKCKNAKKNKLAPVEIIATNQTDELGGNHSAVEDKYNIAAELEAYFTDIKNMEVVNKLMEMEDTRMLEYDIQRELDDYFSLCRGD